MLGSRLRTWFAVLVFGGAAGAGCTSASSTTTAVADEPPADFVISMSEWRFAPAAIRLPPNSTATVELRNVGGVVHEWAVLSEPISAESELRDDLVLARLLVQPGAVDRLAFETPAPGVYQVVCPTPGHIANGMVGTLEVVNP